MHSNQNIDYQDFFRNLLLKEKEDYKRLGIGSWESMYAKYCPLLHLIDWGGIETVSDIGCGTGNFEEFFSHMYPKIQFSGIDIVKESLIICDQKKIKNFHFLVGDLNYIPFLTDSFDLVVNIGILQNFNGFVEDAIKELMRISKKYLYLVTMDIDCLWFKTGKREMNPINRYFKPESLMNIITHNGFEIEKMASISLSNIDDMKNHTEFIKNIHETHTFFILAKKGISGDFEIKTNY